MEFNDFINKCLGMFEKGYSEKQVRNKIWSYISKKYIDVAKFEALVDMSMELYGEVINRKKTNENKY